MRRFMFALSTVFAFALMANPFFILYVGNNMPISGIRLGQLTFVFFMAQTTINLFFGRIADRSGFRRVFVISTALWTLAILVVVLAPMSYPLAVVVFTRLMTILIFQGIHANSLFLKRR